MNIAPFPRDRASDIRHGLDLRDDAYVNAHAIYKIIVSPAPALLAIAAARFDWHLATATVAVMLPTIVDATGIVAFAISVFMYGFRAAAARVKPRVAVPGDARRRSPST